MAGVREFAGRRVQPQSGLLDVVEEHNLAEPEARRDLLALPMGHGRTVGNDAKFVAEPSATSVNTDSTIRRGIPATSSRPGAPRDGNGGLSR